MTPPDPGAGPMRILRPRALGAGNGWSRGPVLEVTVPGTPDPEFLAPGFGDRLAAIDGALAGAFAHVPEPRGIGEAVAHGRLARLALALLRLLSPAPVTAIVNATWRPVVLALDNLDERATLDALLLAASIAAAPAAAPAQVAEAVAGFRARRAGSLPWSGDWALVEGLVARGIDWRWVVEGRSFSYLVAGEGRHRRRMRHTVSERTGHLAGELAERKDLCARLLARHLLPVPRQEVVRDAAAAVAAAEAIGYPVVVKPLDKSGGEGVAVGLARPEEVADAFAVAGRLTQRVIVEAMLVGGDYRLLVIDGRFVAASRRSPAQVLADGRRTVAALVADANRDPRRAPGQGVLEPIVLDAESDRLLAAHGWTRASIPPAGTRVRLRSAGNRARGGTTEDVTARVHPDNAALAVQATLLLGLDVAGVDLIVPDIARSCLEVGGGICEVNRSPSLLTHLSAPGAPDVVAAYLDHALDGGGRRRVPVAAVVGDGAADAVAAAAAAALEERGIGVGVAAAGLVAAGLPLADPGRDDPVRLRRLIDDPMVEAVIVAVGARPLLARGFGHRRCDFAVAVAGGPDGGGPEAGEAAAAALRRLTRLDATTASLAAADATGWLVARIAAAVAAG